jgi:hypothetical protein
LTDQAVGEFESVWEAAGSRIAGALDGASAVVVLGHDPIATASVALGIGRAQASHRRVVIGDLIGDVAPLRELVTDDDPHGITDAFLYGVSLNKIARQIDTAGNLHVLPTGSEAVVQEDILGNDRWRRLAGGFHDVGALMLVAAPAAIPGVEALIGMLDGVVLVGGAASPRLTRACLRKSRQPRAGPDLGPTQRKSAVAAAPDRRRKWMVPVAAVAVIAAVAALVSRNYPTSTQPPAPALRRDSAAASDSLVATTPPPVDSSPPLAVANPADSANASRFAVQIAMIDTEDGAAIRVRSGGGDFPRRDVRAGQSRCRWRDVVQGGDRRVHRSRARGTAAVFSSHARRRAAGLGHRNSRAVRAEHRLCALYDRSGRAHRGLSLATGARLRSIAT